MEKRMIMPANITDFAQKLQNDERSPTTIENYLRHIRAFAVWVGARPVTKELTAAWKEHLVGSDYRPGTINTMLVSLNRFLSFLGWQDCVVKTLRIQRRLFREDSKELTREEYERLVAAAQASGRERLVLLLETICSTGIRVSEVKYITVEALKLGKAEISLKGKIRTILLPNKLCRKLLKYAKKTKNRLRRGVPHQKRYRAFQKTDLGGDEIPLRQGKSGGQQGVPPQPAAFVRPDVLQGLPGRGKAGGRAGPLQRRDHPYLPHIHRRRARPHAGAIAVDSLTTK